MTNIYCLIVCYLSTGQSEGQDRRYPMNYIPTTKWDQKNNETASRTCARCLDVCTSQPNSSIFKMYSLPYQSTTKGLQRLCRTMVYGPSKQSPFFKIFVNAVPNTVYKKVQQLKTIMNMFGAFEMKKNLKTKHKVIRCKIYLTQHSFKRFFLS